jgi:hypothetical protein
MLRRSYSLTLGLLFVLIPACVLAQASPAPSAAPAASPSHLPEVGSVTVAAKAFYSRLVNADIDRSKLSSDLNNALTPSVLTDVSERLAQLGNPLWQYVGGVTTQNGPVYVYSLTYPTGTVLYFSFGVDSHGTIFAAFVGSSKPPGV